jgi:hypothetical protein
MNNARTTAVQTEQTLWLDPEDLAKADLLLRAVGQPGCQELLHTISAHQLVSCRTLQKELGLKPATLTRQLLLLHGAGFVHLIQIGRSRLYSVDAAQLQKVQQLVCRFGL